MSSIPFCKDCKYFVPNMNWNYEGNQISYAVCERGPCDYVNGRPIRECRTNRRVPVIFGGCGRYGRYFEGREDA